MNKWTRRGFITAGALTGGALVVGVAIRPGHRAPKLAGMVAGEGEMLVNTWVKIDADNLVTAIAPHSEMGQGAPTALTQMLADEMDADWEHVAFEEAPAHEDFANYALAREYIAGEATIPRFLDGTVDGVFLALSKNMDMQITGGSTSIRLTGQRGMRIAGAAAREMIVKAAAKTWKVPARELRTESSHVYHDASGQSGRYADFAEEAAKHMPPSQPKMKEAAEYRIMGKPKQRFDIPSKVDGTAKFGIDADLPGMKYAAVMGAPVIGSTIKSVDTSAAEAMPGVIKIVQKDHFVAVVADGYWQAQQAIYALDATFDEGEAGTLNQEGVYDRFRTMMSEAVEAGKEKKDIAHGNARKAFKDSGHTVEFGYEVPFLAHAAMEPLNATVSIDREAGTAEVWTGSQNPLGTRNTVAEALGFKEGNVTVHNQFLGGGFGRRATPDYPVMAAEIAAECDFPVKMIWSREEDTQQDWYRLASISRFKIGLDDDGMPVSWDQQYVDKHDPPEAAHPIYNLPNVFVHYIESDHHMRFGAWRSVDHTQHGFYIESAVDELADTAGKDPYEYRRALLAGKPRHIAVLDAAAKAAGWGKTMPEGQGIGISIVESFGTICAQVVEVDMTGGMPRVTNVYVAADPGFVINPDGFTAQMESGVIYGLTAALYGEITIDQGRVVQSNFHDYEIVRMDEAPEIHVTLINSGARLGGGGEPGTPPIAPALANAIFNATGTRLRSLPLAYQDTDVA
ncbi:MAG: molybdopterin cofactor-binding domain-containing protein [Hyphomonadaceae bacterium]